MAALPPDVQAASRSCYSTLSRRRIRALGHTDAEIDHWLACGLLTPVVRGHYVVAGSMPHEVGRLMTALERSGPGARIGGAWACGLHGLEGFNLSGIDHALVDPRRRVRGVPFTVVRSPVAPIDQATVRDLPSITVTRSLIDIAPAFPPKVVRVAYDHARRAGTTSLAELTERAAQLGRVRGAPEMRRMIATGLLRHESEGERDLAGLWHPGDPLPEPQVWVARGTRCYRLDFAYLDARLCLEYDGKDAHSGDEARLRDGERDLALAELDIQTLHITARMLRVPERTRERILAVRQHRLNLALPPLVPSPPPWCAPQRPQRGRFAGPS